MPRLTPILKNCHEKVQVQYQLSGPTRRSLSEVRVDQWVDEHLFEAARSAQCTEESRPPSSSEHFWLHCQSNWSAPCAGRAAQQSGSARGHPPVIIRVA